MKRLASFILLAIFLAALAPAQTGRLFPTVEAIVGGSERVYSGYIRSLTRHPEKTPNLNRMYRFVVAVDETIKGPVSQELCFNAASSMPEQALDEFLAAKMKFLWVSTPKDAILKADLQSKMGSWDDNPPYLWFRLYPPKSMERYVDYDSNVFTTDLRVIGDWEDFLKEAKAFVRKYPKVQEMHHFTVPHTVARMCGDPNAFAVILTPKSTELVSLARALSLNPEKAITESERKSRRLYIKPKLTSEDVAELRKLGANLLRELGQAEPKS